MNKKKSRTVLKCTDLYDKALSRYQNLLTVREEMEKELEGVSPGKIRGPNSSISPIGIIIEQYSGV